MSRASNLFTVGIFIIFLAILFHYFCRTRKKPEMIVQQQVLPEGYVYPITPNNMNQQQGILGGPNHSQMYSTMPLPYPVAPGGGGHYPYPYSLPNNGVAAGGVHNQGPWPTGYTNSNANQTHTQSAIPNQQPMEDLPPPYHVAVGASAPTVSHHPQ